MRINHSELRVCKSFCKTEVMNWVKSWNIWTYETYIKSQHELFLNSCWELSNICWDLSQVKSHSKKEKQPDRDPSLTKNSPNATKKAKQNRCKLKLPQTLHKPLLVKHQENMIIFFQIYDYNILNIHECSIISIIIFCVVKKNTCSI